MASKILRVVIEVLIFLACLLAAWGLTHHRVYAQDSRIPPDVLMVNGLSCHIEHHGKKSVAFGIATYLEHDNYHHEPWETPPFPERKSDVESLKKDCHPWFAAVKKVQAVTKPVDVNDLIKKEKQ